MTTFYEYVRHLHEQRMAERTDLDDPRTILLLSDGATFVFDPLEQWMRQRGLDPCACNVYWALWKDACKHPGWTTKKSVWTLARTLRRSDGRIRRVLATLAGEEWRLIRSTAKDTYVLHVPAEVLLEAEPAERDLLPLVHPEAVERGP